MPKITKLCLNMLKLCRENCWLLFSGHGVVQSAVLRSHIIDRPAAAGAAIVTSETSCGRESLISVTIILA